ncbi:MAG: addiction module protein [Alphaproteobacteria bacterium]|nr:addiction module protein [Alphaproteobacteria bacterium]
MRCMPVAMSLLVVSALSAAALPASSGSTSPFVSNGGPGHAQQWRKAQAVKALRAEGLRLQEADGGNLTDAHRAELQARLNAIRAGNY